MMEFTKENWENAPEGATLMPAFFIAWEHARVANEVLKRVVLGYLDTGE